MTGQPRVAVVVGNPKPKSRTYDAALLVAEQVTGTPPSLVIDLADVGAALLDWKDPGVAELVEQVRTADVVLVASPTYKATYTGLLKLFLDRFAGDALRGVVAIPLMLGGGPGHALAPELTLRPLLVEIGASVPVRGLYILDTSHDDLDAYQAWLADARPQVAASLSGRSAALP
jgi:FMN reductase